MDWRSWLNGPAPVIEAVDTTFGREGTTVDIIGENFGPSIEASQGWSGVSFDGVWAVPASWSNTEIRVAVPAGVSSGLIVVRSGGHESNGISFTVTGAKTVSRTVVASSAGERTVPEISKLKPDTGQEGESVKIKGSDFGALRGASTVTFNGTAVTDYVSWGETKIQVRVPEGATTGPVVVTVDGEASSGVTFTVTGPVPAINDNGLSPDSGPVGTSVKVKGLNFGASQGESTVTFNGVAAEPTSWSDTKIQVPAPVGATTGPVVVTVDGQASNGVTFTVSPRPRLTLAADLSSVSEPSGTATLTVIDDAVYEGEERIALTAGATGYAASAELTITLEEDEPAPLTARFVKLRQTHGGYGTVSLRILFSEEVSTSTMTLRDSSFVVANGSVRNTRRVDGRSDLWEIEIAPSSDADLVVVLPATTDCAATGAVCTAGGKVLSTRLEVTISWADPGPPVVSIMAVASPVSEGERAEFTVSRTGPTTEYLTAQLRMTSTITPTVSFLPMRFWPGQSSRTGYTDVHDNAVVRDDVTVRWVIEEGEGYAVSAEAASAEVVLEENDEAAFEVSVDPAEVVEGGSATVRVRITNGVTFAEDHEIGLDYSGSTATKDVDYRVSPESLTLRKGAGLVRATLTVVEDGIEEGAETVAIAATHGGASVGAATLTIVASEAAP